ncbi:MAG TPA: hypothetical protein PLG34_05500 [Spirochaetota bacterium]|jgi:uncharacterized lipoprotein YehR (DUF1307 family)|nr:MAG: hypothetical protein BWX91_00087 [Spirochaetes bacterium ADurb.Bin133]HNZ26247.1 hypothetical protein [Spirochaetota bacterium]HPY87419.1 hypothetical protein [Spirochaetota bacterium]HQB61623.1 hypothetical protein [Spirochaetota bacterium]
MKKIKNLLIVLPVVIVIAIMSLVACPVDPVDTTYNSNVNIETVA